MYRLNEDERRVLDRTRDVAARVIGPEGPTVDAEARFPARSVSALAEAGLLGLNVPTAHGGLGLGLPAACAVLEEVARRCPSTAMVYKMHLCAIAAYAAAGEPMAPWLRAAAEGMHLTTLAWSEKGSRSHFWAPVSRAEALGDGRVRVSAEKSWVTSAGHAQGYCISTGWAHATQPNQSMLYLMLAEDPGHAVSAPWEATGMRGNASHPMRLDGVVLGPERALSPEGKGLDVMLGVVLPWFHLGNAAVSIGIAEGAFEGTQAHLTGQRFEHLRNRLADLPTLRARLAQMRIAVDQARAHLVTTLDLAQRGDQAAELLLLESKTVGAEAAIQVTDLAMRACGGAAFSRHLGVERFFRDARAAAVMAPTTDVAHELIGRALCGMELLA